MSFVRGATMVAVAVLGVALAGGIAVASDHGRTSAHSGANGFIVSGYNHANFEAEQSSIESASSSASGHWVTTPVCSAGGAGLCNDLALCGDGTPMTMSTFLSSAGRSGNSYINCPMATAPSAPPPAITNALVLRALRRVDLPASQLGVQPPGGETLVNFDTNFFTDSGAFTRSVRLLGRQVDLRIWPDRFRWVFGDGADLASTSPGARYPDLEITHAYEVKGSVSPSVDTTYAARYRVDGGPWREVTGTVTVPGEPVRLQVRTARPVLVSGH